MCYNNLFWRKIFFFDYLYLIIICLISQVDINELHQQSINFNEVTKLNVVNKLSNKIDMIPYRSQEDTNITIITPSENTSNLSLSKQFLLDN